MLLLCIHAGISIEQLKMILLCDYALCWRFMFASCLKVSSRYSLNIDEQFYGFIVKGLTKHKCLGIQRAA